jgi:hypothetical protein
MSSKQSVANNRLSATFISKQDKTGQMKNTNRLEKILIGHMILLNARFKSMDMVKVCIEGI